MIRFMLAATAAAAVASTASANISNVYLQGSAVHVRYKDLDLHSREGRAQLQDRIHDGARLLCSNGTDGDFPAYLTRSDCYRVVVANGTEQMNRVVRR